MEKNVLLTLDPHYIPGYAGYCPQLKYRVGRSYGQLTAELLTSPQGKHSDQLVLGRGHVPSRGTLRSTSDSFIPRSQNYFACTYSETCRKALSEFHQDGRAKIQRESTELPAIVNYTNTQVEKPRHHLREISNKEIPYRPLKSFTPTRKPYFMDDDNPHKYFKTGFTGHVPTSRFLIGQGFPITTNQALIQFGKQQQIDPTSLSIPGRRESTITPIATIYPSDRGVVPSFTGHIPGQCQYQFTYGQTFGQLSQNALEKSGIKRIRQAKS
ncbi:Protein FAM166B [Dissostichus eleginoides]|uniref:Ciliary microtubule inner protein 2B n=1 Tax=Dissostichus eleginoides TaxID=100907 RepID=A0AAD9BI10_DISEL|nr:Protein FAM166B [Dissostichus eleginoides]